MKFKSLIKSHWPWLLVLAQVLKVAYWFRRIDWSSPYPILNFDYVQYYARALRADIFLTRADRFWGYDPFQMAGYISGPFLAVGTYLFSLISHALSPFVSIGTSLLFQELILFFLMPFAVWATIRLFGGATTQAWIGFGFVVLAFGGIEKLTSGLIYVGLFGYLVACFLAMLQVGLAWKWMEEKRGYWMGLLVLVSLLVFQAHPASLLIVGPANLLILYLHWRDLRWNDMCVLAMGVGLVVLTNHYWIHPFLHFSHWMDQAPYFVSGGGQSLWHFFSPFQPTWTAWGRTLFYWGCLWLMWMSLRSFIRSDKRKAILFGGWLLWVFVLAFFGSFLPVFKSLQPGRLLIAFWLVIWICVGFSFEKNVSQKKNRLIGFFLFAFFLSLVHVTRSDRNAWAYFSNTIGPAETKLIQYLDENAPQQSRTLVGCSDRTGIHFGDLIPILTKRSILGGPHPGNFMKPNHTLFAEEYMDGEKFVRKKPKMFGHSLLKMTEYELSLHLRRFNVGLIVARSPVSWSRLNLFDTVLIPAGRVGPFQLYDVNLEKSWFIKGKADLEIDYDALTFSNVKSDELILKFHWAKTLRSSSDIKIEPFSVEGSPLPFIRLQNPKKVKEFIVFNSSRKPL